jgi:hypothetical protein
MDITAGTTYRVTFPKGMSKTDFTKCLRMARRLGKFDGAEQAWTITVQGTQGAASVREMASRGADVREA